MIEQLRIPFVRTTYAKPAYAHAGFPAAHHTAGKARSDPKKTLFQPASAIPIIHQD